MSNNEWVIYFINSKGEYVYYLSDEFADIFTTKDINNAPRFNSPYPPSRTLEFLRIYNHRWKSERLMNIKRKQKLNKILNKI